MEVRMGYYSSVNRVTFESALTVAEMEDAFEKFRKSASNADYLEDYVFLIGSEVEDGLYGYVLEMDDYYAKHYAHSELASFIAEVIAPEKYCFIEFTGEDDERWGYLVLSNEVHDLTYEVMVNGKSLSEFLSSKTTAGCAECEGNSRRDKVKDAIIEALRNKGFDKTTTSIYELAAEIADEVFDVLNVSEEEQDSLGG